MADSPYIDVSKFPPDEKEHIIDLAKKYNALREDVDGVIGVTDEEKQETFMVFAKIRKFVMALHGNRFNFLILIATFNWGLAIVKQLGGLSPDQTSHLWDALIKLIEKASG